MFSNDSDAFPSNIFHEKTISPHSAFSAKNDCATPTGGHVHNCSSMITDHVADRWPRQEQLFGACATLQKDFQVLGLISSCSSRATRKDCIAAVFSRQPHERPLLTCGRLSICTGYARSREYAVVAFVRASVGSARAHAIHMSVRWVPSGILLCSSWLGENCVSKVFLSDSLN